MNEDEHIAKMSEATKKLSDCILSLNLSSAEVVDVLAVILSDVIGQTATEKSAIAPIMDFVNNRVNQMIEVYENAGLPAWTRKADS